MNEELSKIARYYDFKINNLWMIAGTSHKDEQTLEFFRQKEKNLKSVQIKTEIARPQNQKETKESLGSRQQNVKAVIEEEEHILKDVRRGGTHEEGQFSDIVIKKEEDGQNLNSVLKEEVEKDIKQSSKGLDETVFLSHVKDL